MLDIIIGMTIIVTAALAIGFIVSDPVREPKSTVGKGLTAT